MFKMLKKRRAASDHSCEQNIDGEYLLGRQEVLLLALEEAVKDINRRKESVRTALNSVGFDIPEGLRLEQWCSLILEQGGEKNERTE